VHCYAKDGVQVYVDRWPGPDERVVGWPITSTHGCSTARSARVVISSRDCWNRECTEATDVEGGQELVVPVERPVGLNVQFGAVQQPNSCGAFEFPDLLSLRQRFCGGHALQG
jgi:hypothetical protein